MKPAEAPPPVRVGAAPDGTTTYIVDMPPEDLPPVLRRDLETAWEAARNAAVASRRGGARGVRFQREDGSYTHLALTDADARCWAGAVDRTVGMHTSYGLSLCLRLLALVDLLARARWATGLFEVGRGGARLDPSLLRLAASSPLTAEGRFDETGFRKRLGRYSLDAPFDPNRLTGVTA